MSEETEMTMEQALRYFAQRVPVEAPKHLQRPDAAGICILRRGHQSMVSPLTPRTGCATRGAVHGGVIAEAISIAINALAWYYAGMRHNPVVSLQLSIPVPP